MEEGDDFDPEMEDPGGSEHGSRKKGLRDRNDVILEDDIEFDIES